MCRSYQCHFVIEKIYLVTLSSRRQGKCTDQCHGSIKFYRAMIMTLFLHANIMLFNVEKEFHRTQFKQKVERKIIRQSYSYIIFFYFFSAVITSEK